MEFKRSEPTKVCIYGIGYELKKPDYAIAKKLNRELELVKGNSDKQLELMGAFVTSCGLSQDVLDSMEMDHVIELVEFLTPKKKESSLIPNSK